MLPDIPSSLTETATRAHCFRCFRPSRYCFCKFIHPIETETHLVFLMHPKEARKIKTGTGRLAHLALPNSTLLSGVSFTKNATVNEIIESPVNICWLLYPVEPFQPVEESLGRIEEGRRRVIFILDGTWHLTKKMLKSSPNLQVLPRIGLPEGLPSRFRIKNQPRPGCVSTIEAVFHLLGVLEKTGLESIHGQPEHLMDILDRLVGTQLRFAESQGNVRRVKKSVSSELKHPK